MHLKSDSETSLDASTPPRSPQRRPVYYVQSPSQYDVAEKMSYGGDCTPLGGTSPPPHYRCSPIHHSRESSSTSRFSASVKNPRNLSAWKKIDQHFDHEEEEDDDNQMDSKERARFYIGCFIVSFVVLFSFFSLILWLVAKTYKPVITMQDIVFQRFNVQAGMDRNGVATNMLTLDSKVTMKYRNPGTFFGVHVSATPLELYYFQKVVASGHMKEFYQSRKSETKVTTSLNATMVPLYGALSTSTAKLDKVQVPFNLTFVVRSRAFVLGKLVKPKFYRKIRCFVTMKGTELGHKIKLPKCDYS